MTFIDLTKDKMKSKNEFLTKVWEFIGSVRDETASDVPDEFLETALFTLIKELKAQVAAANKATQIEEEQGDRPPGLRILLCPAMSTII